ncbi:hypothetical protein [Bacillus sp. MUM 13]|uniref:hypothetical protein n=1 Tax=Bacillus sp. MUM 13 TaxID=1678001 RepID=UPI0008F58554|nr:hypothetical protein [Bacillus sp. MUM 13]OIK12740.1 hypothetical protein BIV59_07920 [Bacillus sp. MUM 13]
MKNYFYTGILIGACMLAGCSTNAAKKSAEDMTNGQSTEAMNIPAANKERVLSIITLKLTPEQKENYYKKYGEIVENINAEEGTNHLELVPINEFQPQDWIEPEEFRKIAADRATWQFTSESFGGDPVE